jgi:ribosomal protein S18 acetylase RimI-like enzyme
MHVDLLAANQHEAMADLLADLHQHYNPGRSVARKAVLTHLLTNILAPDSMLRLVVASEDGELLGFAAVYLVYSLVNPDPEQQRQCALKELFVRPSKRSRGVGKALMAWVACYAQENGCCRIDWSVKASNHRGISFYEGLGSTLVDDRLSYRLGETGIAMLAG